MIPTKRDRFQLGNDSIRLTVLHLTLLKSEPLCSEAGILSFSQDTLGERGEIQYTRLVRGAIMRFSFGFVFHLKLVKVSITFYNEKV